VVSVAFRRTVGVIAHHFGRLIRYGQQLRSAIRRRAASKIVIDERIVLGHCVVLSASCHPV